MNHYFIYGLKVESETEFDAPLIGCGADPVDVHFKCCDGPIHLKKACTQSVNELSWNQSECLWNGRDESSFYAADGDLIYAWGYGRRLTPAFRDLALACVFVQRGDIALHASSASWGNRADLFVGASGTGKSTTAAAVSLLGGAEHISDDICRLSIGEKGVCVSKGAGEACLEESAFSALGSVSSIENAGLSGPDRKIRVRVSPSILEAPVPVERVFMLVRGGSFSMTRLAVKEAFERLLPSVLLFPLLQSLHPGKHMKAAGMLISQAEIYSLTHSGNPDDLSAMVDCLNPARTSG